MKKHAVIASIIGALTIGAGASPAQARVNLDIRIGEPAPVIVAPMPPPPPPRHRYYVERRPRFMYTPSLGFAVSVGSPYDMVYYGDRYYVFDDGRWFWAPSYDGPWVFIDDYRLPGRMRRFRHEEISRYRDEEYRRHGRDDRRDDWHGNGRGHDRDRWR